MNFAQNNNEAIDVAFWYRDDQYAQYPEGARDKTSAVPANYWMFSKLTGKRFVVEV